ncbi:MAG: hypothetical protein HKN47_07870, partial [Pirellulaceae bacterium]|nr:hypothetical protein [Pirellulaceae bacterium]
MSTDQNSPNWLNASAQTAHSALLVDRASLVTADDYRDVFRQICTNRYFTNHGPLAKQFEQMLEDFLEIENVVSVGNESLALLIAIAGLNLTGDVIVPAFRGQLPTQICKRLGLRVRHCDVDPETHQASIESVSGMINDSTEAVCIIETWGNRCDQRMVEWLCQKGIRVIVLAIDSFGSATDGRFVTRGDRVVTVYGFGPHQIVSANQGGAIAVSDNQLAERYRNIRSSYGTRSKVDVKATCNGRFSEFQAGVGIASFQY